MDPVSDASASRVAAIGEAVVPPYGSYGVPRGVHPASQNVAAWPAASAPSTSLDPGVAYSLERVSIEADRSSMPRHWHCTIAWANA